MATALQNPAEEVCETVGSYDPSGRILEVTAIWDPCSGTWVATSPEVAGLVAEAEDLGDLVRRLSEEIPAHLEASGLAGLESFELRVAPIPLVLAPARQRKGWSSMADFRARLQMPMLERNPVLEMRQEERF